MLKRPRLLIFPQQEIWGQLLAPHLFLFSVCPLTCRRNTTSFAIHMAFASVLPLSILHTPTVCSSSSSSSSLSKYVNRLQPRTKSPSVVCCRAFENDHRYPEEKKWQMLISTALATAVLSFSSSGMPALADLNKFEADIRGEFGIGSAAQYGSADLRKAVHVKENLRRANFTSADMRESDFSGSTFNGAYLEKAVAYKANFSDADLSDTLMDRMVLNEANLTNAVLVRSVLTRSDLGGAIIEGADFSDAVLDLPQKQALCKYASGTNPTTGVSTRTSLGCGNTRRNAYGTPSSPLLSAPPQKLLDRDGFCDPATGLCDAK